MTKDEALTRDWKHTIEERIARDSEFKEALEQPAQGIELEWYVKGWDDAKKDWQVLTDDEIDSAWSGVTKYGISGVDFTVRFARAIEQALKDKNAVI
jgi:hypothetical protein